VFTQTGLLKPKAQRKTCHCFPITQKFTINEDQCLALAERLADGEDLRFQSVANRNWVAKKARTIFGVNIDVRVSKDQLFDPARTVEGSDLRKSDETYENRHYMTLYVAERAYVTDLPNYTPLRAPSPSSTSWPFATGFGYTR
jgi:hypothetical protein